jgi:Domain of unknown function (DUF4136)
MALIIRRLRCGLMVMAMAAGLCFAVAPVAAVDVKVEFDKMFDFSRVRTWAWNENAGQVVMARTREDDPEAVKKRAEPIILDSVNMEMPRRGLKPATGMPDVTLIYYLLLTVGSSSQSLGQFLPSTAQWGLPPFAPSTTSLSVIQQGSLVLDVSANGKLIWRGIGEAEIKPGITEEKRAALLREGVRDILRRFPPK